MATRFPDTLRALEHDSARGIHTAVGLLAVLLLLWSAWFFFGQVTVTERSTTAQLQIAGAATVAAPMGGQITEMRIVSGQYVSAGDLLFELATETGYERVRAPTAGQVQQMAELFLGSAVRPGDILGVIVPPGTLGVIATFPPSALSHMQPGLPARLRVDSTVGVVHSVPATVTQVVQDSQTRQVRVRLALTSSQDSTVLQHGLSGSVDVAVEQVTPATLVLRAIGQMTASI